MPPSVPYWCALIGISVVRACVTHCSFRLSSSSHLKKFRGSKKDDEVRPTSTQKRSHCIYYNSFLFSNASCLEQSALLERETVYLPSECDTMFSSSFCLLYVLAYRVHGSAVIMFQMTRRWRRRREARMRREGGNCTTLMMKKSV